MKLLHLNHSDDGAGAARAAYRLHRAMLRARLSSRMMVNVSTTGDPTVYGPKSRWAKGSALIRPGLVEAGFSRLYRTDNAIIHSPAVLPSGKRGFLNACQADVLHLHWVQNEMLSIEDLPHLHKPLIWTLHDMWAFCGAEHVSWSERWKEGYRRDNAEAGYRGLDINRWTWRRKQRNWKKPVSLIAPSRWLAACVQQSALMKDWPVRVIPNAIDTDFWCPVDKALARTLLGLPEGVPLVIFGTSGANAAYHKGFDLLEQALSHLRGQGADLELAIFGQRKPKQPPMLGHPVHYLGILHDDLTMRLAYCAADALIVPSRIDNLPNTAVEAMACGTPVVAFDTCGLPDIVDHQSNGFLARAFDAEDLATGISWTVTHHDPPSLRQAARQKAVECFSESTVLAQHAEAYEQVLGRS